MDAAVPPSQDEATEGTMSSEAFPLIFDPLEDVTSEAAPAQTAVAGQTLLLPGGVGPPAASPRAEVDPEQLDAAETDGEGPSNAPPPGRTSPETVAPSAPDVPPHTEQQPDRGETSHMAPGHRRRPSKEILMQYYCKYFPIFFCLLSQRSICLFSENLDYIP